LKQLGSSGHGRKRPRRDMAEKENTIIFMDLQSRSWRLQGTELIDGPTAPRHHRAHSQGFQEDQEKCMAAHERFLTSRGNKAQGNDT